MKNIVLTGMMGSGKTTIANLLGRCLHRQVIDTDDLVVEKGGMPIADMFALHGEAYMRDLETQVCRELSSREDLIIACGGGLPLRQENREYLRESSVVIFLRRDPGITYDTMDRSGRPLAQQGRDAFIRRFQEREPIYQAFSHVTVNDFSSTAATVSEVLEKLEELL